MVKLKEEIPAKKINVALVCTSLQQLGGKVVHLSNIYNYLNDNRFRVKIICSTMIPNQLKSSFVERRVDSQDLIFVSRFKKWLIAPGILELKRVFLDNKIDIVHTFQMQSDIFGGIAARLAGIKYIFSIFESKIIEDDISIFKQLFYKICNGFVKRFFIKTIVISNSIKNELISGGFRDKNRIEIIYPGYEYPEKYKDYQPSFERLIRRQPIVGAIGRLSPEKGMSRFIAAMPYVLEEAPEARFIIIGIGKELNNLKTQVKELSLENKVNFIGWVNDVFPFLEEIDIFVMPSVREGFGFPVVEASFLSKPVVASKVGGIEDIIEDGKTGFLVDTSNPQILADKVLYLCNHPEEAALLGKNACEKVLRQFTIENEMLLIRQLYLLHGQGN